MKIAMVGSGSWGTAMISQLATRQSDLILYSRNKSVLADIRETRENRAYLPGVRVPEHVQLTSDLEKAVSVADVVILSTPSKAISATAQSIKPFLRNNALVILTAKGLSEDGRRLSVVVEEILGGITNRIAVLSGPNHAEEVGRGQPAATVVAAKDKYVAMQAQDLYMLPRLRAYYSTDVIGVEYGGVLKNIIALAAGAVDGLKYGDNAKAALITRGLTEMVRYACFFGANMETLFGLSGIGDLMVTCNSVHSRNHAAGIQLAQGKSAAEITNGTNMVVEGIRTTAIVYPIACKNNIEMPITEQVYEVLQGNLKPENALEILLAREKKEELQEPLPSK